MMEKNQGTVLPKHVSLPNLQRLARMPGPEDLSVHPKLQYAALLVVLSGPLFSGCMDQYRPEPYWAQFSKEREVAARPQQRLTEAGELPTPGGDKIPIDQRYAQLCAGCHGAKGDGDGPAGVALVPKPRALTDAAWQASVDDARITKVIKDGGPSVGLSASMAPWGAVLSDAEIAEMVAFVRSLKK